MTKATNANVDGRAMLRRRATAVREERLAKLQQDLLDETLSRLESDLARPLLCGPFPPLVATIAMLFVPMLAVLAVTAFVPAAPLGALASIGLTTAFVIMKLGSRWWGRREESRGLPFRELMLWTWLRHRRAEQQLTANTKLLGLSSMGRPVSTVALGSAERLAILHRLNAALELKDPYTLGHSRRVEKHAYRAALALRLRSCEIEELTLAAALHDIGKLAVPDHVLRKPGALSDRERDAINRHSAAGAEILGMLDDPAITAIVRSHHERWDGRGYPDGLAGHEIPLGARIIAVADTYDAMTSSRPYRAGSSRKRAVAVLRDEAGHQFDPEVVEAFLPTLRRSGFAALVALALTMPRRFVETVANTLKDAVPASAVSGTTALGAALVVVTSVATLVGPSSGTRPRLAGPVADADVEVADEVLGKVITRAPDRASKTRRTKNATTARREDRRTKAKARVNKTKDTPDDPPAPKDEGVAPQPAPPAEDPTKAAASDPPKPKEVEVVPSVPLDPQEQRGDDCTNEGNVATKGGTLHCGS
ncbi:MAG TPA: HD domain-containing phosphohydrolase [Actinomycetota bacterium]|nr:HD domain-containing phosphohydrolase [Actinomycetota bacterium]